MIAMPFNGMGVIKLGGRPGILVQDHGSKEEADEALEPAGSDPCKPLASPPSRPWWSSFRDMKKEVVEMMLSLYSNKWEEVEVDHSLRHAAKLLAQFSLA